MSTYYVIDNVRNINNSLLEYLNKNDKAYFILSNFSKDSLINKWLQSPILKEHISVERIPCKISDILDFRIVPFLTELCFKNPKDKIVLISNNPKLKCLKKYFYEYLNFQIEIVPSVKFYVIASYIGTLINSKDFDLSADILYNLIQFKQINLDFVKDRLKIKLAKNNELTSKLNNLYTEFKDIELPMVIPNKPAEEYLKDLEILNLGLTNDKLKILSYYLKKSESLYDFKEKIVSSNNLELSLQEKQSIFKQISFSFCNQYFK